MCSIHRRGVRMVVRGGGEQKKETSHSLRWQLYVALCLPYLCVFDHSRAWGGVWFPGILWQLTGWKKPLGWLQEDQRRRGGRQKSSCEKIRRGTTSTTAIVREHSRWQNFFPFFVLKKGGKLTLQNFERLSLRSVRFCLTLTKEPCFLFSYRHLRRLLLQPTLLQFKPNHECSRLIRVFASLSTAIHSSTAEVHKALQGKELRDTE